MLCPPLPLLQSLKTLKDFLLNLALSVFYSTWREQSTSLSISKPPMLLTQGTDRPTDCLQHCQPPKPRGAPDSQHPPAPVTTSLASPGEPNAPLRDMSILQPVRFPQGLHILILSWILVFMTACHHSFGFVVTFWCLIWCCICRKQFDLFSSFEVLGWLNWVPSGILLKHGPWCWWGRWKALFHTCSDSHSAWTIVSRILNSVLYAMVCIAAPSFGFTRKDLLKYSSPSLPPSSTNVIFQLW